MQHKKTAIDPATVTLRFFHKGLHRVAIAHECAVATGRLDCGDRGQLAMGAVKGDFPGDVDIGQAIAIGKAERFARRQIVAHAAQAPARQGVGARIDQRDAPWLGMALMHFHQVFLHIEGDVGHVQEVVGKNSLIR